MFESVLAKIRPLVGVEVVSNLIQELVRHTDAHVAVGGSLAKDTHLAKNHDCDIFVRFKQPGDLSDLLQSVLDKAGVHYERVHGSRDYFQFEYNGIDIEVVPVKFIDDISEAENTTDASYLHILWARKHLDKRVDGLKLHDHVRLLKQLCKTQRVYGAESFLSGFSGHVLDILVVHYGGFLQVLQAASSWEQRVILDPEHHYTDDPLEHLNQAKTLAPLVLVDPIDKQRNAAAALSKDKFERFKKMASKFLETKDESMFFDSPATKGFELRFSPEQGKKDVVGAKMLKRFEHIIQQLKDGGFTIHQTEFIWEADYAQGFVAVDVYIDKEYVHQGPPVSQEESCSAFRKKHGNVQEKDGRLFVVLEREFTDARELMAYYANQLDVELIPQKGNNPA